MEIVECILNERIIKLLFYLKVCVVDFKNILESFAGVAAVLAVDLTVEHGDDRYRVIDGNDAYKRTVVQSLDEFEKDVPYTRYIVKAANFEALCDSVAIARRKGGDWYLGAMTDWDARELEIDLARFLPEGSYSVEIFRDGINADRNARDYAREMKTVTVSAAAHTMTVHMAPGGGWTAKFTLIND